MRVTNNMISNSVLFNTQRSLNRFFELETKMSTGRQINKPSDDPIGILKDLDYRDELSQITQFLGNIGSADNWVRTTEDVIYELNQAASTAKDLAVSMANDSISTEARTATASQIQQAIDSIIQLGNTQIEGRYLFSGYSTDVPALSRGSNGVVFQGDEGIIKYNIESGIGMGVNTTGNHVFLDQFSTLGEDSDLNVGVTGTTLLADLHDGNGISLAPGLFTIEDVNRGISASIDISGAVTVDDALTLINNGLTANGITNLNAIVSEANNSIQFNVTNDGLISNNTVIENLFETSGLNLNPGVINLT
ncbi:MAG: flagellar hook-associated protein 3, partial [Calditrichaeota bacterium]